MTIDIRSEAARYYDLNPHVPNDVPFYKNLISSPDTRVLELGCGTGRVLLSLSEFCSYIYGMDVSEAMISICQKKLKDAGISAHQARVEVGNITNFDLGQTFDLIIAPFRVFQNLETNSEVSGLFRCVRQHLAPDGTCILNVFRPFLEPDALRREWCTDDENLQWEIMLEGERITCHDRRSRMNSSNLTLYPELIYRRYAGNELKDETVLKIVMRCYYPRQLERIIIDHGFRISNKWGGYAGEIWGEGPELVVQFADAPD